MSDATLGGLRGDLARRLAVVLRYLISHNRPCKFVLTLPSAFGNEDLDSLHDLMSHAERADLIVGFRPHSRSGRTDLIFIERVTAFGKQCLEEFERSQDCSAREPSNARVSIPPCAID